MLFKTHLLCFKPCTCSSSMDRDISKLQPEEAARVRFENVGSICQSIDDKSGCKNEEETGSSASCGRKSFSFITERGFLRRILGSNDKDRSLESEREPIHNSRKSVSNSQEMEYETSFKEPEPEPDIDQEVKYVNKVDHKIHQGANVMAVELEDMAEEDIITERNPSEEAAVDTEVMEEAVSNEKEVAREDSMLCFQESPSFRVYCAHNVTVDGDGNEENGDKDENKSLKETTQKGSENQAVKRRQTRFRTPLRNGGAARMKNFKFASCSCSNPSTTQESARRSVGKGVR